MPTIYDTELFQTAIILNFLKWSFSVSLILDWIFFNIQNTFKLFSSSDT